MKNFYQKNDKFYCADCHQQMKIIEGFIFCENCENSIDEILIKPEKHKYISKDTEK